MGLEQFSGQNNVDAMDKHNAEVDLQIAARNRVIAEVEAEKYGPKNEPQLSQVEIDRNDARELAETAARQLDRYVGQLYGSYVMIVPKGQTMPEYLEKIGLEKKALMQMVGIKEPVGVSAEQYQKSIKEQLSDNEVMFNLANKYEANTKVLKSDKFEPGSQVNVQRTNGAIENDWFVQNINELYGTVDVAKNDPLRGGIAKTIPIAELGQLNK